MFHRAAFLLQIGHLFCQCSPCLSQHTEDSSHYVVQTGQLSGGQDEITLIINSTFDVIADRLSIQDDDSTAADNSTDATVAPSPDAPSTASFHRLRNLAKDCRRLTDTQKYGMLQKVGALNQQWMANTAEEAGRNFAPSFGSQEGKNLAEATVHKSIAGRPFVAHSSCDETCRAITAAIKAVTNSSSSSSSPSPRRDFLLADSGPEEVQEGRKPESTQEGCALQRFIPVGNCTAAGEEQSWGYVGLCSFCRGVYMLSENCFPSLLNAVQCKGESAGCIYDSATNTAHGRCEQQTISVRVLRDSGKGNCEDWQHEFVLLPVGCGCLLSTSSFLSANPFGSPSTPSP